MGTGTNDTNERLLAGSLAAPRYKDFLTTEYSSLRDEILKRTEIQYQLISFALIALGVLLPVGIENTTMVILIYPILVSFLSMIWSQNDIRIREIRRYIIDYIEQQLLPDDFGWEGYRESQKFVGFGSVLLGSSRFVFTGMQLLAILVAFLTSKFPIEDVILFLIDGVLIVLTILMTQRHQIQ